MKVFLVSLPLVLLAGCAAHQGQPVASLSQTNACKPVLGATQQFASQQQLARCEAAAPAIIRRAGQADQAGLVEANRVARVAAESQRQQDRAATYDEAHPSADLRQFEANMHDANLIMAAANGAVACQLRNAHWYAVLIGGYSVYFDYEQQITSLDSAEIGAEMIHANAMMKPLANFDCQQLPAGTSLARADATEQELAAGG